VGTERRNKKQWESLFHEMDQSGVSRRKWCEDNDINYHTMSRMRTRMAKDLPGKGSKPSLEESRSWVRIAPPSPKGTQDPSLVYTLTIEVGPVQMSIQVSHDLLR